MSSKIKTSSLSLQSKLDRQLEKLEDLSREELVARWVKQYGNLPPKGMNNPMLVRSSAYQLQAERLGGLKSATHKDLLAIAGGEIGKPPKHTKPAIELKPGMRLMREWHGQTHQVEVLEKGFEWQGKVYGSLSSIAKAITGTKWSGPRFFGLSGGAG